MKSNCLRTFQYSLSGNYSRSLSCLNYRSHNQILFNCHTTKTTDTLNDNVRWFGTKVKKNQIKTNDKPKLNYQENKDLLKDRRTEIYHQRLERQLARKTRRKHSPKNVKKKEFESWFLKRREYQEIQDKLARRAGKEWKIKVACVVERLPVVTPDKEKWMTDKFEMDNYLSQFGFQFPADSPFGSPKFPEGYKVPITEQDFLDELPEKFKPAPRITLADETNDTRSLERKLPKRIFLTVVDEQKNWEDNQLTTKKVWTFPTAIAQQDETLLETAKRATKEAVGDNLIIYSVGNSPMAVDLTVYDNDTHPEKDDYFGEKIFYFRLQRDDGDVDMNMFKKDDYAWLCKEEIVEKVIEERGDGLGKLHHYLL